MQDADFLKTAEEAARQAGAVLQQWRNAFTVTEKSPANVVTEADFAAQETISRILHERYPEHHILGEEGLSLTGGESPYRWVVDPLDGTANYVHGFPYYAVSIALERDGDLAVGVIFDPTRDELFSAVAAEGAWLNGQPIHPSRVERLRDAMVVASLPVNCRRDDPAVEQFLRVMPEAQSLQRTGSAALNLASVAAGRIDAYWSRSLKAWDMAAGVLLIKESGGRVSQVDGSPVDINVPDILASNGSAIHKELQQLLR